MKQKTACLGLFSAVAIILGYVESLVPVFAGIPGIKLGLANLGVLFILKKYSFREAALVSCPKVNVLASLSPAMILLNNGFKDVCINA